MGVQRQVGVQRKWVQTGLCEWRGIPHESSRSFPLLRREWIDRRWLIFLPRYEGFFGLLSPYRVWVKGIELTVPVGLLE